MGDPENNNENAIVLGGTRDKAFAMGTFLASFFDYNDSGNLDVVIFHDGIAGPAQDAIRSICPCRCLFKEYQPPFAIDETWNKSIEHFTPMVFCKYECLRLLESYKVVVWFDYDMLVSDKLDILFSPVAGGMRAILAQSIGDNIPETIENDELRACKDKVGIHAPCIAFYDTLPHYLQLYEWCIKASIEYAKDLMCPDQVVFSMMVHKFGVDIYPLVFELFSPHPLEMGMRPTDRYVKIWHSYREKKFWDSDVDFPDWTRYFCIYLARYLGYVYGICIPSSLDSKLGEPPLAIDGRKTIDSRVAICDCLFPAGNDALIQAAVGELEKVGAAVEVYDLKRRLSTYACNA